MQTQAYYYRKFRSGGEFAFLPRLLIERSLNFSVTSFSIEFSENCLLLRFDFDFFRNDNFKLWLWTIKDLRPVEIG